jgi:TetR/AcrR family transcriptional regulator, mexJK operon transcriptional repressor
MICRVTTGETASTTPTMAPPETETRSERKRRAILDAATQAFLSSGYSRTSMDEIARLAQVSKQTVYMHFGDKERLLFDIVMTIVNRASHPVDDDIQRLGDSTNLDADLRDHARRQLALILQPQPMQLRRLVIAEAVTFPELGRAFYELGPGRTITELTKAIQRLTERGLLHATDPARAASDLNWLIMSDPLNQAMLLGDDGPPDPTAIAKWADQAVTTFLAAYGPTGSRGR